METNRYASLICIFLSFVCFLSKRFNQRNEMSEKNGIILKDSFYLPDKGKMVLYGSVMCTVCTQLDDFGEDIIQFV